jgi:hypothetical protein
MQGGKTVFHFSSVADCPGAVSGTVIRRDLGMSETQAGSGTLNLDVLVAGGRTIVSAQKPAA